MTLSYKPWHYPISYDTIIRKLKESEKRYKARLFFLFGKRQTEYMPEVRAADVGCRRFFVHCISKSSFRSFSMQNCKTALTEPLYFAYPNLRSEIFLCKIARWPSLNLFNLHIQIFVLEFFSAESPDDLCWPTEKDVFEMFQRRPFKTKGYSFSGLTVLGFQAYNTSGL